MIRALLVFALLFQYSIPQHTGATAGGTPTPTGIAGWPMNEGSGLTLHDTIGGNTATINTGASVTWQSNAGLPGTTPLWNNSGYALAASTTQTNFTGATPFTLSVWAYGALSAQTLMSTMNATAGTYQGWEMDFKNAGGVNIDFFLVNSYPSNAMDVQAFVGSLLGGVHNYVITYDGSKTAAGVKIYADAVLLTNTVNQNSLTGSAANGIPLHFGERIDGTNKLAVPMAFCEIWNSALSGSTIAANYAAGPGIY